MSMDMTIKNVNGTVTEKTVFAESAAVEVTDEKVVANATSMDVNEKAAGATLQGPALTVWTSVDVDKLVDILGQQVRNARTDLQHCNLACAMTMLVNNGQVASEYYLSAIANNTEKLVGLEKSLVDEEIKYDTIIQGIQVEIEKLTDQINKEKDPDRKKELQAQLDEAKVMLERAQDEKKSVIDRINAEISGTQADIDAAFARLNYSQKLALAVATATVSYVARQRSLSGVSEESEQAKATLDGLESLALHLDKLQPGFRQACESAVQLADEILGKRRSFM